MPAVPEPSFLKASQELYAGFSGVRDRWLESALPSEFPQSLVIPLATYSPWLSDDAFMAAFSAVRENTLVDIYRCHELWTLARQLKEVPGDVLEVGVWRGGTAGLIGMALRDAGIADRTLHLCDTFRGVVKTGPEDPHYRGGEHADTSIATVEALLEKLRIGGALLHQGIFPDDTAPALGNPCISLCHIDVDAYRSALDVFEWVWARVSRGGIVVFDAYGFRGCEGVSRLGNELKSIPDGLFVHNLNGQALLIKR